MAPAIKRWMSAYINEVTEGVEVDTRHAKPGKTGKQAAKADGNGSFWINREVVDELIASAREPVNTPPVTGLQ